MSSNIQSPTTKSPSSATGKTTPAAVAGQPRVALVHDWLTGYRGGEKVLEALCEMFPQAPLYTLVHVKGSVPPSIEGHTIRTSFIQNLPLGPTKYRHYLPLFPLAAETLITEKYDLVISTSHAVAKSVRVPGARHWCYIHSPMRYIWDRFDDYFGPTRVGWLASKFFFAPIAAALRWYDRATSTRVHQFVANSRFVAQRVMNCYGAKAEVIHPPCEVEKYFDLERKPQDYYLFFSALVPYKRADLAILACQNSHRKLVVLGSGPELESLKKIADPQWITFFERPSNQQVREHFEKARALIFPAVEDFGIVPVEATAAGLPVIGLHEGGLLDSQNDSTCLFFREQTEQSLMQALDEFEKSPSGRFDPVLMRKKALEFSQSRFKREVRESLERFKWQNSTH